MVKRLVIPILYALFLYLALSLPALAAIASPDTMTINSVNAYYSLLEDDDQLYLIDYTIDYGANPDENVTEAFLARLMDGDDELGQQAPYSYYDDGYDRGVVSIYFTADDAPTWAGDYTVKLEGNPTLDWVDRPIISSSAINFTLGTDQSGSLAAKVLYLADQLEMAWSVDLIETTGHGSWLTDYGEDYFSNVIYNLSAMCPTIFSGSSTSPEVVDRTTDRAAGDYLRTRTGGTPLDPTDAANGLGVSGSTLGIGLSFLAIIICLVVFGRQVPGSGVISLLAVVLLIAFTLVGWIALYIGIGLSALGCIGTIYIFTLEKSSA